MTRLSEKPFALLGVHVGGADGKRLREIMAAADLPWRSFVDLGNAGTGLIATQWNHVATPTFYVIDHVGVIRHKWTGAPQAKTLDDALDELIRAVPAGGVSPRR